MSSFRCSLISILFKGTFAISAKVLGYNLSVTNIGYVF